MAKILVVDDQEAIRVAIKLFLSEEYPEIVEASNVLEALRVARETLPDCIIMDWALPGGDGVATARRIRETIVELEHVPIIICTAMRVVPQSQKDLADEFGGFLPKPFRREDLLTMVKTVLPQTKHRPANEGGER